MKTKKFLALASALALAATGINHFTDINNMLAAETDSTDSENSSSVIMSGDIDGDGVRDLTDLSLLSLYLVKDQDFTDSQKKAADIDKDGNATFADLASYRQFISKVNDVFEESKPLLAIVYENYAWGHTQRMQVVDASGRIYSTESCEDETQMTDMKKYSEGITESSEITSLFSRITDNAELTGTATEDVLVEAVNARDTVYLSPEGPSEFSKDVSFMNDFGTYSLYIVDGDSLVRVAAYGDVISVMDNEPVERLVSALASEKIFANTDDLNYYNEEKNQNKYFSKYDGTEFVTTGYQSETDGVKYSSYTNYYFFDPSCTPTDMENYSGKMIFSADEYKKCFSEIESGRGNGLMEAANLPENYFDEGNAVIYVKSCLTGNITEPAGMNFTEEDNRINLYISAQYGIIPVQHRCWSTLICVPKELLAKNTFVNETTEICAYYTE